MCRVPQRRDGGSPGRGCPRALDRQRPCSRRGVAIESRRMDFTEANDILAAPRMLCRKKEGTIRPQDRPDAEVVRSTTGPGQP